MDTQFTPSQLWENYTKHNARKWLGTWAMWDPNTRSLLQMYDSIRHIALSENGTKIWHQNTSIFQDGRVVDTGPRNGPWEYTRDLNCDEMGLIHPGRADGARAVFFNNGGGAWTVLEPRLGSAAFVEIFFPHGDIRFSSGVAYRESGDLFRMTLIREDVRSRSSEYWSSDIDVKKVTREILPSGDFKGEERTLSAELHTNEQVDCAWGADYWLGSSEAENEVFALPDNIFLSCPLKLFEDNSTEFHISYLAFFKDRKPFELWEQTVYFQEGRFSHIKQGIYRRV
ncbi:predicted protein [Nematostella vectensis]|uniref:DUF3598 domain-containing protein n=1 Tax=Nematostella vectensis TaxID=45351 RepID=A7RPG4_NEMVE|nr:predicted protein [Nematostella vectensis]|eukprot:XP_001638795.1 predicted protein [Nematostella vectensis]